MATCFINAKEFGGNNATATLLSPTQTQQMLAHRYGQTTLHQWRDRLQQSEASRLDYHTLAQQGRYQPIYRFGEHVLDGQDIVMDTRQIKLRRHEQSVTLFNGNDYAAYREKHPSQKE